MWEESEDNLNAWVNTQWPIPLETALRDLLRNGRLTPDQVEWKCGSWEELTRLFGYLLAMEPGAFDGEPLEVFIEADKRPKFCVGQRSNWGQLGPAITSFKRWRVLPRLFLESNHPLGGGQISFTPSPPTAHERMEARLLLREWLADKLPPSEIERLLS